MNKYLFLFLFVIYSVDAYATFEYSSNGLVEYFDDTEIVVQDGVEIGAVNDDMINMSNSVRLYNYGTINADINADTNNLIIYNYGTINGSIVNGGEIRQMITDDMGINNINVSGGNYTVHINNVQELHFSDIKNINAESILINNSWIYIDDFNDWQNWDKNVSTSGTIHFKIADKGTVNSNGEFIQNVSGAQSVIVEIENLDDYERTQLGSGYYLSIVRENNYEIIDNNENTANTDNALLNEIRESDPNDRLISALDYARNAATINKIKNKSYRFNHDILLRPLRVINNFSLMDNVHNKYDLGAGIKPTYTVSDKISGIGTLLYLNNRYNDFYYNLGISLNYFKYHDDINEFSGMMYGFDIGAKQYFNNLWINGSVGLNLTKFDANYIMSGNKIENNPYGISWHLGTDIGYDFNITNGFVINPFVGMLYQNYHVVDVSDNDFYVRAGMDARYSFAVDGIKYEYGITGAVNSNLDFLTSLKFGFWSITDMAGATVNIGMLHDDTDYHYQLSVDAKMVF